MLHLLSLLYFPSLPSLPIYPLLPIRPLCQHLRQPGDEARRDHVGSDERDLRTPPGPHSGLGRDRPELPRGLIASRFTERTVPPLLPPKAERFQREPGVLCARALSLFGGRESLLHQYGCGKAARRVHPHQPFIFLRFAKPARLAVKLGEARRIVMSPARTNGDDGQKRRSRPIGPG